MSRGVIPRLAAVLAAAFSPFAAFGQDAGDLAKKLSNPIASLISVPLQSNYDRGVGPGGDGSRLVTNIQPVVPFSLNKDWNLISRTIVPITALDPGVPGVGSDFGMGDMVQSLFFSPQAPGPYGLIWGVGPVALLGTSTEPTLGTGQWGAGPTGVALRQQGPWSYGVLANHIWSFAQTGPNVNATYVQPFLNYTTKSATTIFTGAEITYDWNSEEASPVLNAGVNQLIVLGKQPIQIGAGLRWWPDSPANGPTGIGARLNLVFLFPK